MKRRWWVSAAVFFLTVLSVPTSAIDTLPTPPPKVAGPFLITGYSFSGPQLRYVQIYNASSTLASLEGWRVVSTTKSSPAQTTVHSLLSGSVEPGHHTIAALDGLVEAAPFLLNQGVSSAAPLLGSVQLLAPQVSSYNDETIVVPTISATTPKETNDDAINYYARRDISSTTGNYVSGFTFIATPESLKNDDLYVPPTLPTLRIVEVYADASTCSPFNDSPSCIEYVELFNDGPYAVDLSQYRLRSGSLGQAATSSNSKLSDELLAAGAYSTLPMTLSSSGSWLWIEDRYGIQSFGETALSYPSTSGHSNQAWAYNDVTSEWQWTELLSPGAPNQFIEPPKLNLCTGLKVTEVAANVADDDQFVELYNASSDRLELSGCSVQTNRSQTSRYVFGDVTLEPGSYVTVFIKDTDLTLTKTTTGSVSVFDSSGSQVIQSVEYANLPSSSSYALVGDSWVVSYQRTPNAVNQSQALPSCAEGYERITEKSNCTKQAATTELSDCGPGKYRSPETNRCRSLESLATALTPCDVGQFRSPETNRCRSLSTSTSTLTLCAFGQERNPATNRCRSTTAASGSLQPCAENQERNPTTNRCRAKANAIKADFPVEVVAQTGEATLGWWAFGGVGCIALGYAGWEWRREVIGAIRKVSIFSKLSQ